MISLSTYLTIYLPTSLLISLCTYLPIYLRAYLSIYSPTYLLTYLSTYLLTYLSTYLPTSLPSDLSICLPTYLLTYLPKRCSELDLSWIKNEMFNDLLQNEFFHSPAVNNSQILTQSLLYPAKGMESFQMGGARTYAIQKYWPKIVHFQI